MTIEDIMHFLGEPGSYRALQMLVWIQSQTPPLQPRSANTDLVVCGESGPLLCKVVVNEDMDEDPPASHPIELSRVAREGRETCVRWFVSKEAAEEAVAVVKTDERARSEARMGRVATD